MTLQAGDGLKKALTVTGRNLGVLKLTDTNLREDRHDKWTAHNIDNSVLKLRKRRSKHRWVMGGVVEHSWFWPDPFLVTWSHSFSTSIFCMRLYSCWCVKTLLAYLTSWSRIPQYWTFWPDLVSVHLICTYLTDTVFWCLRVVTNSWDMQILAHLRVFQYLKRTSDLIFRSTNMLKLTDIFFIQFWCVQFFSILPNVFLYRFNLIDLRVNFIWSAY